MARLALASVLLAAPLVGGCSGLLGIEDPVAEFPVTPEINGHYLVQLIDQDGFFVDFHVELSTTPEIREVYTTWQSLDFTDGSAGDPREPHGEPFFPNTVILTNTDVFEFETIEFDVRYLGTGGEDVQLDAELTGRFPILDGQDEATTDGFCGEVVGAYLSPIEGRTINGTYAGFKIENQPIEDPVAGDLAAVNDCAGLISR